MSTYAEKLKHPLWQRKRLEILNRDGFKCRCCGNGEKTLHVHHLKYTRGRDPWDYPDASLVTLCEVCHETEHEDAQNSREILLDSLLDRGARSTDLYALAVAIDYSGPNDRQITGSEWESIAGVLRAVLAFRHAGGELDSLRGLIQELCAKEGEE